MTEPLPGTWSRRTREVVELLRSADVAAVNLENGLSTQGSAELGGFEYGGALRGPPKLAKQLARLGIDAVSLANNHTGNFGQQALRETVSVLESAGVATCGAGVDLQEAFAPCYLSAQGLRVAIVSVYSLHEQFVANDLATEKEAGIAFGRVTQTLLHQPSGYDTTGFSESPYRITPLRPTPREVMAPISSDLVPLGRSLKTASDQADLVVLSVHFHWGRHQRSDLPAQQRSIAAYAFDAGADLVIGHGPHVLRGIEHTGGKVCAYSLGNVALQPEDNAEAGEQADFTRQGGLLRCEVSASGIETCELYPITIRMDGMPEMATTDDARSLLSRLDGLSRQLGTDTLVAADAATINSGD